MASIGKKLSVSFIGVGKLGQACAEMVAEVHDVVGYDINPRAPENFPMVATLAEAVTGRDIVFIAVETPHDPQYDGKAPTSHLPNKDFDYSVVKTVLKQVNEVATKNQLVVLISTVLPGTTRSQFIDLIPNARFVYNPYLIAMGTVKWDMVNPEMVMIGTEDGSETGDAKELVDFYKTVMQNDPAYHVGTWDECECLKVFYNCYSDDTEVLTSSGWKLFKDAQDDDMVFSLDPERMRPEWVKPDKWASRDWDDEMIHFHSSKDDILVTPGHNMFVGRMSTKDKLPGKNYGYTWELDSAENIIERSGFVFQRSTTWHKLKSETINVPNTDLEFKTEDFVQFMAWFLAEGCICNQSGRIIVSQDRNKNSEKYEMINETFLKLYENHPAQDRFSLLTGPTGISVLWPEFSEYLRKFGKSFDKFIPDEIKNLDVDMLRLFLDTYNLADGSALHTSRFDGSKEDDDKRYKYYATSSDQMAADIGELIIKVGRFPSYRTTITDLSNKECHLIYELVNKTSLYQRSSSVGLKFNKVQYSGKVYCAMLPKNHIFLTRRNGKCTWQGNTFISAKVSLVNMIQDVAEKQGNINSEWVCDALAKSDRRIMGPAYMKPGMGDGGHCHPRDNIALRYMAEKLDLGYDLFDSIMLSREVQAENMAKRLMELARENNIEDIVIVGKAYKPLVPYTGGSASMLVGHYIKVKEPKTPGVVGFDRGETLFNLHYLDEQTGDTLPTDLGKAVYLMAHCPEVTYGDQLDHVDKWYNDHTVSSSDTALTQKKGTGKSTLTTANGTDLNPAKGSVIVDPWRKTPDIRGVTVVHYGNTRK